jgi:hypothetical protein
LRIIFDPCLVYFNKTSFKVSIDEPFFGFRYGYSLLPTLFAENNLFLGDPEGEAFLFVMG